MTIDDPAREDAEPSLPNDRLGQDSVRIDAACAGAMALMSEYRVEPTPINYEVCFTHVIALNPHMSNEIARSIAATNFDGTFCVQMHDRYLARPALSAQMLEASESIARELSDVVVALREGGEQGAEYANVLTEAAASFDGQLEPQSFQAMVNGLAHATRDMVRRNGELAKKVAVTTQQMDVLQSTLRDVRVEALTDALTGLANRRAFDDALTKRMAEATGDLCLLICDIDHFKRFNDTWGHVVGDQVIRFIARILHEHTSGEFLAARYGGEEFAIVMPRTNMHRAQTIAGAIRQAVKARRLTRKSTGETIGGVALSMGIARRRLGESSSALIERADRCLYASKQTGRDRITIDSDLPSPAMA